MLPLIPAMLIISIVSFVAIIILNEKRSRKIILAATLINMIIAVSMLVLSISSGSANYSISYQYISSPAINIAFQSNVIVLALLVMSSVVLFVTALAGNPEKEQMKMSSALIALFQISAIGLFSSANLIMFFIFWDIGVVALFLMINTLGSPNRKIASINFLMYEILASSLLLLGILLIYFYTPVHSFDIATIMANAASIPPAIQGLIFVVLFVAFMINMPIFPMHFWLPDAHTEASTQGSMLLSGILTKFGAFGMLILFAMLPIASQYSTYIAALAIVSTIYAVFVLMRQTDLKRIIAYSTIVEMGIILLGISAGNAFGTYGAVYAMLSHGIVIALMFLLVGTIKHLFGERSISVLKGIVADSSVTAYAFLIGILAMIGLPLTSGFIADILLFIGAFQAFGIFAFVGLAGILLMAAFMYYIMDKSMLSTKESSKSVDILATEQKIGYAVLIIFIFIFGLLPFTILSLTKI